MKSTIHFLVIMAFILGSVSPIYSQNSEQLYQKGLMKEEGEGELSEAIVLYNQIVENQDAAKSLQAKALLHIGMCYEKMGMQEATKAYQNLVNNFPRQESEVAIAKERLSHLILISEKISKTPLKPTFREIKTPFSIPFWSGSSFSPDGKIMAFGSQNSIWTVPIPGKVDPNLAGEPRKLLGTDDVLGVGLSWSGDGRWIAFSRAYTRDLRGGGTLIKFRTEGAYIDVIPSSGGAYKRIAVPQWLEAKDLSKTSLSRDGKTVAFDAGGQIFIANVETGIIKQITKNGGKSPCFSPDGTKIAYLTPTKYQKTPPAKINELWVISANGKDPIKVSSDLIKNLTSGPIWSPDGKMIVYSRIDMGEKISIKLCIVSLSDQGRPISSPLLIDLPTSMPASLTGWTPDNKIGLLFETPYHEYIYTVPVNGGKAFQVSPLKKLAGIPNWSPDGKRIYFRWKSGLGSAPVGGGKVKAHSGLTKIIKETGLFTIYPGAGNSVSPDGKFVVFSAGTTESGPNIYTIPIEGGAPKQVASEGRYPCWSTDGEWIAYLAYENIGNEEYITTIFKIPRDGGEAQKVTTTSDNVTVGGFDWSPDGKKIAFFSKKEDSSFGTLKLIPSNGGESQVVCQIPKIIAHNNLSWSPDGQKIAFTSKSRIWVIPTEGGEPTEVKTDVDARVGMLDWSPDGQKIAFSGESGMELEYWFMEDFLPLEKQKANNEKAELHLKEGNRLYDLWEYDSAIEEYKKAVEIAPSSLIAQNAHYRIGQSLFKEAQYDHALTTFNKLIKEFPESVFVPVTELMITQVEHAIANNQQLVQEINADKNIIVDPETGIAYRKIKSFAGKNDWITYTSGGFNMSPDCRFLVHENSIVPVDGSDAFKLVDMNALRAVYSPKMNNAAFYADSSIWMVPVSPESGRSVGNPKKLIEGSYKYQGPVNWSPDGKKIVFVRRENNLPENAWALNILDNSLSQITEIEGVKRSPVWSPNGKSIIYNSEGTIWQTAENIKEPKIVVENQGRAIPHWSPDGKWLYLFGSSYDNDYLYSFEHKNEYRFNHPKQIGRFCSFTPNGDELLFYRSSFDDKWGMKVISSLGGPSFSPALNCEVYYSQWSKDSKNMLAMSVNVKGDLTFKVIPFAGGNPVEVKIDVKVNGKPIPIEASPDLTQLIFSVKLADGLKDLYIVPLSIQKGKTMGSGRLIFEDCLSNVRLSWSPDGSKLALLHDGDIWIVPLNGEDPSQVTDTPENERWVEWSPNGKMISYIIQSKQTGILHVLTVNGENSAIVSSDCQGSDWSPNSKSLAVSSLNKLSIIGLDGKEIYDFELSKEIDITNVSNLSFSPKGKYFAFHSYSAGEESIIYLYSFETKEIIRLEDDDLKYGLVWSPDGKWLSYLTYQQEKVRPEGVLWEVDFAEIKEKLLNNK